MSEAVVMMVIPEPKPGTRAVLVPDSQGPVIRGHGPLIYLCGVCRDVLLEGLSAGQVANIVVKCFGCGVYNEVRAE